jgi:hypothetical protein
MTSCSPCIPVYFQSPTAHPPEHKALLTGINYAYTTDKEQSYRELKGPVNDAKDKEGFDRCAF